MSSANKTSPWLVLNNGVKMPALGLGVFLTIRWHLDHGFSAIPKSVRPARIVENFDVFDFSLSAGEIATIDALDTGARAGGNPETFTADSYPTDIDAQ